MSTKKQISLDEWYKANNNQLERNKQKQLEETYVNNELMNKYLNQNLENQGLAGSGIAELYRQQANTDYMNSRANVNSDYASKQQDLYNQYFAAKKEEEDIDNAKLEEEKRIADAKLEAEKKAAQEKLEKEQSDMFKMYAEKIGASLDDYGYLSADTKNELNSYFDRNAIGEHYSAMLDEYMNLYTPNEEQKAKIEEQKNEPYYALEAGKFNEKVIGSINEYDKLYDNDLKKYMEELESIRGKVGEKYYQDAKLMLEELKMTEEENKIAHQKMEAQLQQEFRENYKKQNGYYPDDSFIEQVWDGVKNSKLWFWNW